MDVSIILINYNTFDLTKNAIESILTETKDVAYEIILVDNQSPDGSGERLRDLFGDKIIYIQAGGNLGTAKAFNLAYASASGTYLLWLNSDVLLKENFVKELFDFMEKTPDCGICGGNIFDADGEPAHSFEKNAVTLKSIRHFMSLTRYFFEKLSRRRIDYNYTDSPIRVAVVMGADMMIRRAVIEKAGLFDENIFMYCEETEFAYRMQKETEWKAYNVPYAHIYHLEGASFNGSENNFSEKRYRFMLSGYIVYFKRHFGEKAAEKYLKLLCRSYLKFMIAGALLFMRNRFRLYRQKRKIVLEYIKKGVA